MAAACILGFYGAPPSPVLAGGRAKAPSVYRNMPDDMLCSINIPRTLKEAQAVYPMQIAACTRQLKALEKVDGAVGNVYKSRGDVYVRLEDCRHAIADFSAAIAYDKNDPYPYLDRGLCYRDLGDVERALADFDGGILAAQERKDRNIEPLITPSALYALFAQRGRAMLDLGRPEEALRSFRTALILRPKDDFVTGLMAKAEARLDARQAMTRVFRECRGHDPIRSIASCAKLIEDAATPKDMKAAAHLARGVAFGKDGKLDEAVEDLGEAIRLEPDNIGAYKARGRVFEMKGDKTKAAADYRKALEIGPKDEKIMGRLDAPNAPAATGNAPTAAARPFADCESGDPKLQIEGCSRVLAMADLAPKLIAGAHYNRGLAYGRTGDDAKAVNDFTKSLAIDPRSGKALLARGLALVQMKREKDAFADFSSVVDIEPENADAHYFRGVLYARLGTPEGVDAAITDMTAAIYADPRRAKPYYIRGVLHAQRKEYRRALTDLEKFRALGGDNPSLQQQIDKARKATAASGK